MEKKERLDKGKNKRSLKTKIVTPALAGTLLLSTAAKAAEQGKAIEGSRENDKEIFSNMSEKKISDTTIDYNTAESSITNETKKITTEEIREFITNNKDEIMKNLDEITKEKVCNELLNNEDIIKIIKELMNDEEIRDAAIKGDEKLIQKKIGKIENERLTKVALGGVLIGILLAVVVGQATTTIIELKRKKNGTKTDNINK